MTNAPRAFNLPMLQHSRYRLCLTFSAKALPDAIPPALVAYGFSPSGDGEFTTLEVDNWRKPYSLVRSTIAALDAAYQPDMILYCGDENFEIRKNAADMAVFADSLWLGEALIESRMFCYLQPVCRADGSVVGYESFARVHLPSGEVIAGNAIMQASKALGIEFAIDKHLHAQAIATFAKHGFDGLLFVNFFPGFIQRPAIYLDGLLQTAMEHKIDPSRLVLDMTKAETRSDIAHLVHVCEFAKAQGCKMALDDIESLTSARKLIPMTHADFVKIDRELVHKAHQPGEGEVIASMVELARSHGASAIAEGVETEAMLAALKTRGVELFQGYYFAQPMHADAMLMKKKTG